MHLSQEKEEEEPAAAKAAAVDTPTGKGDALKAEVHILACLLSTQPAFQSACCSVALPTCVQEETGDGLETPETDVGETADCAMLELEPCKKTEGCLWTQAHHGSTQPVGSPPSKKQPATLHARRSILLLMVGYFALACGEAIAPIAMPTPLAPLTPLLSPPAPAPPIEIYRIVPSGKHGRFYNWSMETCASDPICYPSHVQVSGLAARVATHGHFTVATLFPDILYVWLEGPELKAAHVKQIVSVSQCCTFDVHFHVELSGNYKMHVRVDAIGAKTGFHRELFQSPYSIFASGSRDTVDLRDRPVCLSASAASNGSWVHKDRVIGHDFDAVVRWTRDDYIWVPQDCRLRAFVMKQFRDWFAQPICACGDSYLRTQITGMLYSLGLMDGGTYKALEHANGKSWHVGNVSFLWATSDSDPSNTLSSNAITDANWDTCTRDARVIVISNLEGPPTKADLRRIATYERSSRRARMLWVLPHPWSHDLLHLKRNNLELQRIRTHTLAQLPPTVDVFDSWKFTHARHSEACDGSHFMCLNMDEVTPIGIWEGLVWTHAASV